MILLVIYYAPLRMDSNRSFHSELDSRAAYITRVRPGVWLVDTKDTAEQMAKALRPKILRTESLLVIRAADDFDGWMTDEVAEFLEASRENGDFDPKAKTETGPTTP